MPTSRKYSILALLTGTICFLAVYIQFHREGRTKWADSVLITMTGGFQQHLFYLSHGSRALLEHYVWLVNTKKQNEELLKEVEALRAERTSLNDVLAMNQRLREGLNFKEKLTQPLLGAHVIAHDASSDYFGLRLDKGSQEGVRLGFGVVSPGGLVGRISQVSKHFAMVQTVIDPASNVDVLVQRSRARGILSGQSKQLNCKIKYLDRLEDVAVGDTIVSTDFGGVFPKGLVVGYVTSIVPNANGVLQSVFVKSAVDVFRLEEVFIVLPSAESETIAHES